MTDAEFDQYKTIILDFEPYSGPELFVPHLAGLRKRAKGDVVIILTDLARKAFKHEGVVLFKKPNLNNNIYLIENGQLRPCF